METIYLDTCALNRLLDVPATQRIRQEAEAVDHILELTAAGEYRWASSSLLRAELEQMPDPLKLSQILPTLTYAAIELSTSMSATMQATALTTAGLGIVDALHLAICEEAGLPVLLTVDDRFIRRAARRQSRSTRVENPVDWLKRTARWQPSP